MSTIERNIAEFRDERRRRRTWPIVAVVALGLAAIFAASMAMRSDRYAVTPAQRAAKQSSEQALQRAITGAEQLHELMRDPDSFRLVRANVMNDGAACYVYRSRNGFGGMNVGIAVMMPDGELVPLPDSNDELGLPPWSNECSGRPGVERTLEIANGADVDVDGL